MRKKRQFLAVLLILALTLSGMQFYPNEVRAEGQVDIDHPDYYYRNQLIQDSERVFYQAMEELYTSGGFTKGNESQDVSEGIGQAALKSYADGDIALAQQFQNARDAFMYDYAGLFYIDWSKLTLRVGQKDGGYVAYVGNGAYDNYYKNPSMASEDAVRNAIAALDSVVAEIAAKAEAMESREAQVRFVHDKIAGKTVYTYREDADAAKAPNVEDAYGCLVNKQAWCEGYARAFKMVMDRLGIPCVLVSGGGISSAASADVENHMWNDVQMDDGKWYGVDVTFDDPIYIPAEAEAVTADSDAAVSGVRDKYLLKGSEVFYAQHIESGQFSQGGMAFTYPELNVLDYGQVIEEDSKIDIKVISGTEKIEEQDVSYTEFHFSYDGMNVQQLWDKGMRWAARSKMKNEETNEEYYTGWMGLDSFDGFEEKSYMKLYYNDKSYLRLGTEFCVTTNMQEGELELDINEGNTVEISEFYEMNGEHAYKTHPWLLSANPPGNVVYHGEKTTVELVYDTPLKLAEGVTEAGITVDSEFSNPAYTVENLKWENTTREVDTVSGNREQEVCVVTFDFTPDMSYFYSGNTYTFTLSGLVSAFNGTEPKAYNLRWSSPDLNVIPCPLRPAPDSRIISAFPRPAMSTYPKDMFEDPSGNLIDTTHESIGISLIASKLDGTDKEAALGAALAETNINLSDEGQVKSYQTYDLSISCKAMRLSLKKGQKISIALPYPQGFDPRTMAGVTFEAYHFKEEPAGSGNYIPEKLICNATESGIWVIVDSFSPFAVVALDPEQATGNKYYIASAETDESMAEITVKNQNTPAASAVIEEMSEDKTFVFTPKPGYVLDKIAVNGRELDSSEYKKESSGSGTAYSYTVKKDGLDGSVSIVARFKAESVAVKEEKEGITPVVPVTEIDDSQTITPDTPTPDPEEPDTPTPDPDKPDTPTPDPDKPDTPTPDPEKPDTPPTPTPDTPPAPTPTPDNGDKGQAGEDKGQAGSDKKDDGQGNKGTDNKTAQKTAVKTGDETKILPLICLIALSLVLLSACAGWKLTQKKRNKHKRNRR